MEGATRRAVLGALLAGVGSLVVATTVGAQDPVPSGPTVKYAPGQKAKLTGFIVHKRGNELLVRDESRPEYSLVMLTKDTKIRRPPSGVPFLARSQKALPTDLITGLRIHVKGSGSAHHNLTADRIEFTEEDRKTAVAMQISAGEVALRRAPAYRAAPAQMEAAREAVSAAKRVVRDSLHAINERVADLDKYDLKFSTMVFFDKGSASLSEDSKRALDNVATSTQNLEGYIIEIASFADTTGSITANQLMATARANAVVDYLTRVHQIPVRRFANPGAGTAPSEAMGSTAESRAMNRRVDVRVLVNRGLRETNKEQY